MKKRIVSLLLSLSLLLAMAACGQAAPEASASPSALPSPTAEPTPSPSATAAPLSEDAGPVVVSFSYKSEMRDKDGILILTVRSAIPSVRISGNDDVAAKIEESLSELLVVSEKKIQEYQELAEDDYDLLTDETRPLWGGYFLFNTASAVRADSEMLSVKCSVFDFAGGIQGAYNDCGATFDVSTGERLSASDLTGDYAALKSAVRERIIGELSGDSRYFDVEPFAEGVLDGDQWYFDENGLTVFANTYEISTFNEGQVEFHFSYEELEGLIDERWLPDDGHAGTLSISFENPDFELAGELSLDSGADTWYLLSSADLDTLKLNRVEMSEDGSWLLGEELASYSELPAGSAIAVTAWFMDMPLLAVTAGESSYLIAQSGRDTSLLLIPVEFGG